MCNEASTSKPLGLESDAFGGKIDIDAATKRKIDAKARMRMRTMQADKAKRTAIAMGARLCRIKKTLLRIISGRIMPDFTSSHDRYAGESQ